MSSTERKKLLKKNGIYLDGLKSSEGLKLKQEDLEFLKELSEADELKTIIDREYPLKEMVEAHHYVDKGRKKGNVVIAVV